MPIDTLPPEHSPKTVTSLVGGGKLIHTAYAFKHGSVTVVELTFIDSSTSFIKVGPHGTLEIGGSLEMGSGTAVSW